MPLKAHTINEVRYYLMVTPCFSCGKGPWETKLPIDAAPVGASFAVQAHCKHCGGFNEFIFTCRHQVSASGMEAETINPTDEPSEIIDLSRWLSLFYLLIESAAAERSKSDVRLRGYQAAMCLAESLKFYGDNELPAVSAFFSPESQAVFRDHPEKFSRQKLRDMQAKLPTLGRMAQRVRGDQQSPERRWWQFWRR